MTRTQSRDANKEVYEREAANYRSMALQPPEQVLLGLLRGRWHEIDMLDLGVGTGRTTYTFAPIARRYVGIDYSAPMIELSRRTVRETSDIRLEVGDARDLRRYGANRFDLVLFSYNGIDYVEPADRVKIFREVRACLKDDGLFYFSTHSLCALPFPISLPLVSTRRPVRTVYRLFRALPEALKIYQANRRLDLPAFRQQGWALVRDEGHNFQLNTYYTLPSRQVLQLKDAGFRVRTIYDLSGNPVEPESPPADPWLYYLCDKLHQPNC
jgi:SAM-dependent methyltransferase